jgi:hypothetical protein
MVLRDMGTATAARLKGGKKDLYGSIADEQLEQTSYSNLPYGFFNIFSGRPTSANPFENNSRSESTNQHILSIAFPHISKNQPEHQHGFCPLPSTASTHQTKSSLSSLSSLAQSPLMHLRSLSSLAAGKAFGILC